jgi:hypothetical protein
MKTNLHHRARLARAVRLAVLAMFAPAAALAQAPGEWQTSATLYLYLPSVSGNTSFPSGSSGSPIDVSANQILDSLKMAFMGSLSLHNGRWGAFTDVVYVDLGNTKTQNRDFTIGNTAIPAGTSADLGLDLKAWVWTLAGQYRVASDAALTVDLLGGARMLDVTQRLDWNITGSLGSLPPASRSGSTEVSQTLWDAIFGLRGRYSFGAQREWSLPFYVDVGTGESTMTWQAAAGVAYGFKWGELSAMWRTLDYDMKSGQPVQDLSFSGPMIAASFRW